MELGYVMVSEYWGKGVAVKVVFKDIKEKASRSSANSSTCHHKLGVTGFRHDPIFLHLCFQITFNLIPGPASRVARATTFAKTSLSPMDPKSNMKLAMAVDMNRTLMYLASQSVADLYRSVLRSIGSFMATASNVKVVALREKYLLGNQSLLVLKPLNASAAIARVHMAEAADLPMALPFEVFLPVGRWIDYSWMCVCV